MGKYPVRDGAGTVLIPLADSGEKGAEAFFGGNLMMHPGTGQYITNAVTAGAVATIAGVADREELTPFLCPFDMTFDQFQTRVTTGVASALVKGTIYDSDALGRPTKKLYESGTMSAAATTTVNVAISGQLRRGKLYWLGVRHSLTATLQGAPTASMPLLATASGNSLLSKLIRSLAFATPATDWTYATGQLTTGIAPQLQLRLA